MQLFNGIEHVKKLDREISDYLSENKPVGKLGIVLIGDNKSSEKYVSLKEKYCKRMNIPVEIFRINESLPNLEIFDITSKIFSDGGVSSVIVQLPFPREELGSILDKIPLEKDIDLLSSKAQANYYSNKSSFSSPVVRAYEYFMYSNNINFKDLDALVVGGGFLVGKPVSFSLKRSGSAVRVTENYSSLEEENINLVVASAGVANLIKGEDLPGGCNVIDFGSSMLDGKVVGDFDLNSKTDHLGIVSPSPGGMGPLVIRFLIMNHLGI